MRKSEVKKYYDNYITEQYSIGVNDRIFMLYEKLKSLGLNSSSDVIELGCGIGVVTHLIRKTVTLGQIESVDISGESIEFAKEKINFEAWSLNVFHLQELRKKNIEKLSPKEYLGIPEGYRFCLYFKKKVCYYLLQFCLFHLYLVSKLNLKLQKVILLLLTCMVVGMLNFYRKERISIVWDIS